MKDRFWLKALVALVVLVALGAAALRLAAGALVGSDDFRDVTARLAERALKPLLPRAMILVKESALEGLATLVLHDVTVGTEKTVDASIGVKSVRVVPSLLSTILPGPTRYDAFVDIGDGQVVTLEGTAPLAALIRGREDAVGEVEFNGSFNKVDAAKLAALIFAEHSGPALKLRHGVVDGAFGFTKPLGNAGAGGQKTGHVSARLDATQWEVPTSGDEEKTLALPPLELQLEIKDFAVILKNPVVLPDKAGRAVIAGAVELPKRADQTAAWDLEVSVDGAPSLKGALARLFRCKSAPEGVKFKVEGPLAATQCKTL